MVHRYVHNVLFDTHLIQHYKPLIRPGINIHSE